MKEHIPPERLIAYLDGQAEGEDMAPIEQHLASCKDCREALESLALLDGEVSFGKGFELRGLEVDPPPALSRAMDERARAVMEVATSAGLRKPAVRRTAEGSWFSTRRIVVAAAAGILVLNCLIFKPLAPFQVKYLAPSTPAGMRSGGEPIEASYIITCRPLLDAYLYILRLCSNAEFKTLLPYPSVIEPKLLYFDLDKPVAKGETLIIPPDGDSFPFEEAGSTEYCYLIQSVDRLSEESLLALIAELNQLPRRKGEGLEIFSKRVLRWLRDRYPSALLQVIEDREPLD